MVSDSMEEQVLQRLPYRCPYCDQPVSYDGYELKEGENLIECPACHQNYIKIVSSSLEIPAGR